MLKPVIIRIDTDEIVLISSYTWTECRTFQPRAFRPGHFGHGHFGHEKKQRETFRAYLKIVGWGACMHKCLMHLLGNTCLNNLIYHSSPKMLLVLKYMYLQAEMKTVWVLIR